MESLSSLVLNHPTVDQLIQLALEEDCVNQDITTRATGLLDTEYPKSARATIIAKNYTIAAGFPIIQKIIALTNNTQKISVSTLSAEGSELQQKTPWIIFEGPAATLLSLERTMLNFLIRISGIASYTHAVVKKLEGTPCKILHTRKTAPGHRRTDVYGALIGGAHMHRISLEDAILVKENHLEIVDNFQILNDGIQKCRKNVKFIEIEAKNFIEIKYAMEAKPNRILLDNFSVQDVQRAVNIYGGSIELEASGGINLDNARDYAETGVDYISLGSLTHSAPAADLSLLFDFKK